LRQQEFRDLGLVLHQYEMIALGIDEHFLGYRQTQHLAPGLQILVQLLPEIVVGDAQETVFRIDQIIDRNDILGMQGACRYDPPRRFAPVPARSSAIHCSECSSAAP
jgi:hypothetical protein